MVNIRESDSVSRIRVNNTPLNTSVSIANNTDFLSAGLAKDWAIKEDATVDGTDYSSKYYAKQAKNSENLTRQYLDSVSIAIAAGIQPATKEALGGVVVGPDLDVDSAGVVNVGEDLLGTISDKVSASGDTISGTLEFEDIQYCIKMNQNTTNQYSQIFARNNLADSSQVPESQENFINLGSFDQNNVEVGAFLTKQLTDGKVVSTVRAGRQINGNSVLSEVNVYVDVNGTKYATAPTPVSGDNSSKIATTAFVNTDFLKKSGGTIDWLNVSGTFLKQGIDNPSIFVKDQNYAYNETPSTSTGLGGLQILDKNGEWITIFGTEFYTDGRNLAKMQVKAKDGSSARVQLWADSGNKFHCSFPMCTTKPTTTSSAAADLIAAVKQNYLNGTSWYRVWTDGWIEQGGIGTASNGTTPISVSLLKTFSNTNYTVIGQRNTAQNAYSSPCCYDKTATGFKIRVEVTSETVSWYACGY